MQPQRNTHRVIICKNISYNILQVGVKSTFVNEVVHGFLVAPFHSNMEAGAARAIHLKFHSIHLWKAKEVFKAFNVATDTSHMSNSVLVILAGKDGRQDIGHT